MLLAVIVAFRYVTEVTGPKIKAFFREEIDAETMYPS